VTIAADATKSRAGVPLGIVADEISRDFAAAVRVGIPLGLRRYEVRFLKSGRAPMCDDSELREVGRIADGEGVEITALSPGLFKNTDTVEEFRREMEIVYPRAAEWAHRWKLPGLIAFGFHKPGATETNGGIPTKAPPPHVASWLACAGERATSDGLQLMIEPEPICWVDTGTVAAQMMGAGLAVNYDPGNVAWLLGRDPIAEFDAVAPWIANVHIKDIRLPGPQWLPSGEGMIDYRRHFTALRKAGVACPISLEPHMDGSPRTIRRCRDAFHRLWETSE
jgi:sugar phosphate isomerase/epimerase